MTHAMVCRRESVDGGVRLVPAGPIESVEGAEARLFAERAYLGGVYVLVPADEIVRLAACAKEAAEICRRESREYPEQLQAAIDWLFEKGWRVG